MKTYDFGEKNIIQSMVAMSEKARREGILALEEGLDDLDNDFMKNGLRMVVDGTDGNAIRQIMEGEMSQCEARHMTWVAFMNAWAGLAPGYGMMGTVLGLIGMLNNLEDKSSLGPNMAVALITTLYGSMISNWIMKLKKRVFNLVGWIFHLRHIVENHVTATRCLEGIMSVKSPQTR
jgi:chemotaxis protein MotA